MIKSSNDQLLESVFFKIFMDIVWIFKLKTFNCLDMRHFNPAKRTGLYCCIYLLLVQSTTSFLWTYINIHCYTTNPVWRYDKICLKTGHTTIYFVEYL